MVVGMICKAKSKAPFLLVAFDTAFHTIGRLHFHNDCIRHHASMDKASVILARVGQCTLANSSFGQWQRRSFFLSNAP